MVFNGVLLKKVSIKNCHFRYLLPFEPVREKTNNLGFQLSNQIDTNRLRQSQKIARSLKFRMKEEEGLHFPCSENKGTGQLGGYHEAGLCLCFHICRLLVFLCSSSFKIRAVAGQRARLLLTFVKHKAKPDQ